MVSPEMSRSCSTRAHPIDPNHADTAIFYSISNAQKGLAGISFGGFLIKRVVDAAERIPWFKDLLNIITNPGFPCLVR